MLISSRRKKPSFGAGKIAALPHAYRNLYGTGLSGVAPSTNIKALGMSPDEPEVPLLSHRHVGHTSVLKAFLSARTRPIKIVARVNVFARDERGRCGSCQGAPRVEGG
jgi:7,8-dihydropterin-6-yl-methyl-4-(beta-D-ribofuranosyl)aminobenzene 5'-phosphate synthase